MCSSAHQSCSTAKHSNANGLNYLTNPQKIGLNLYLFTVSTITVVLTRYVSYLSNVEQLILHDLESEGDFVLFTSFI